MTEEARIKDRARSKAYYWKKKKERENNPELQEAYRRANQKKYMKGLRDNPGKRQEYNKRYYQEHKEYFKNYNAQKRRKAANVVEDIVA